MTIFSIRYILIETNISLVCQILGLTTTNALDFLTNVWYEKGSLEIIVIRLEAQISMNYAGG